MRVTRRQLRKTRAFLLSQTARSPYFWVMLVSTIAISTVVGNLMPRTQFDTKVVHAQIVRKPLKLTTSPTLTITVTPTPIDPTYQAVDQEIHEVFGTYYSKAMLLLQGNGQLGACHENAGLNPNAVNVNSDGSRDVGIFQINTRWQGVTNEAFLTDYHINIRMAWNIFERNHHSFSLWTCGRAYGI